jgi:hypothetical protein
MNQTMSLKILLSKNTVKLFPVLIMLSLLGACATSNKKNPIALSKYKSENQTFTYTDMSGTFTLKRDVKIVDNRLYVRQNILVSGGLNSKSLEKTISVSQIGRLKVKKKNVPILRPFASQYEVWLDKKRYFVQGKSKNETRSMTMQLESPEKEWNGKKEIAYPTGKVFCYLSQVPECAARTGFLLKASKAKKGSMPLHVIWESFPYNQEQYSGMKDELFSNAKLSFAEKTKTGYKFALEMEKHTMFYHFNNKLEFQKYFWISQGISMIKNN